MALEDFIKENQKPVYYMPNPGNWGDGLIHWATIRFFRKINISPTIFQPDNMAAAMEAPPGLFIYGGGGAWCKNWKGGYYRVRDACKIHEVLVLPSSYEDFPDIKSENITYYRRDNFDSARRIPKSTFCHDMVFSAEPMTARRGSGTGYFFRTDKESAGRIRIPDNNIDISAKGDYKSNPFGFFNALAQFETIHTDRLHVAISCALLSKKCFLYEGSHFKNGAVYESSIKDYSDCVRYVDFNNMISH